MMLRSISSLCLIFFLFHDTATTEIYTLSLHDALPISRPEPRPGGVWPLHPSLGARTPRLGADRDGEAGARRWRFRRRAPPRARAEPVGGRELDCDVPRLRR